MFWGLLSAATNVRQNSFLSIPEDDHFGDDYVMTVIEFGVRGEAVYAGQVSVRLASPVG